MRAWGALAVSVLLCAGCTASASSPEDANGALSAGALAPPHIAASATHGTVSLGFALDVAGTGSARVGRVDLASGAGQLALHAADAPSSAAVVGRVEFAGAEVYQVLAVSASRWDVAWIYCHAGALLGIYVESTDGAAMRGEAASGACVERAARTEVPVDFPAFDLPAPMSATGARAFAIDGEDVSYDAAGAGRITLDGDPLALFPFSVVDCTSGCGEIGWYELHSIVWDAKRGRASFGVLYLYDDPDLPIEFAYSLTLPTLTRYADALAFPGARWRAM